MTGTLVRKFKINSTYIRRTYKTAMKDTLYFISDIVRSCTKNSGAKAGFLQIERLVLGKLVPNIMNHIDPVYLS